jgi:hypothetical protein
MLHFPTTILCFFKPRKLAEHYRAPSTHTHLWLKSTKVAPYLKNSPLPRKASKCPISIPLFRYYGHRDYILAFYRISPLSKNKNKTKTNSIPYATNSSPHLFYIKQSKLKSHRDSHRPSTTPTEHDFLLPTLAKE